MTSSEFNKAMGQIIDRLRKQRGISLAKLGIPLGVSYQQIQKFTTGLNAPSIFQLWVLASVLGVTVTELYEQAGVKINAPDPSPADNDAVLAARYVAKIPSESLRRNIIDFARKCAYEGTAA